MFRMISFCAMLATLVVGGGLRVDMVWQKPLPFPSFRTFNGLGVTSSIDAIDNNTYFTTDLNGIIYAIDLNSADKSYLWQFKVNVEDLSQLIPVKNSDVLLICFLQETWGVNKYTGQLIWANNTIGIPMSTLTEPTIVWTNDGNIIFQNSQAISAVSAWNPKTGEQLWSLPNTVSPPVLLTPTIVGSIVQNPSTYRQTFCGIGVSTGQVAWKIEYWGGTRLLGVSPYGAIAVNISNYDPYNFSNRKLFAVEGSSGKILWVATNVSLDVASPFLQFCAIVQSTLVSVSFSQEHLIAYDLAANGRELWRMPFDGNLGATVELVPLTTGQVIVSSSRRRAGFNFSSLNAASGQVEWSISHVPGNAGVLAVPIGSSIFVGNVQGYTAWNDKGQLIGRNYHESAFGDALSTGRLTAWGTEFVVTLTQSVAGYTIQETP